MMKQRKTDELKPSPALTAEPKKVIIKSADMKDDMQKKAVNIAISAFEKNNVEKDVAEYIKKDFNKKHGPTWHCIVGRNFDAGKSTTGGQILFLSGQIDDLTIQKYEKEAKDKSRESWVKLLRLEEHTLRLRSLDLLFWMRQESYALAFSNVLASKRKLQGNKQFKLKNGST
ncbi:hypothetical protein V6Z11_A04G018900 [Gossypium hirsutum]